MGEIIEAAEGLVVERKPCLGAEDCRLAAAKICELTQQDGHSPIEPADLNRCYNYGQPYCQDTYHFDEV